MKITLTEVKQRTEKWVNEYFDNKQENTWMALNAAVVDKNIEEASYLSTCLSRIEADKEEMIRNVQDSDTITSVITIVLLYGDEEILDLENNFFNDVFGIKIKYEPF